jgi:uncharacterized protein (DUF362 family)
VSDRPSVGFVRSPGTVYPSLAPFDPSEPFPELARLPTGMPPLSTEPNPVYGLVRQALREFGLDRDRFGTPDWNPLGGLVPSRGLVVLKPNLVLEMPSGSPGDNCLTTHGSVVRVLLDYVRLAGGSNVDILIGDVPLQGANFELLVQQNGLQQMVEVLKQRGDHRIELRDLRRERALVDGSGFIRSIERQIGDPRGYREVNVGSRSRLEGLPAEAFEGFAVTDYRRTGTKSAHAVGRHTYLVPQSILDADLFINLPKLKTHQKAGLTVAIKNLVGINGDKSRIPHFRIGGVRDGGDEYPPDGVWLRALVSRSQRLLQGRSRVLYHLARRIWRVSRRALASRRIPERAAGSVTLVAGGAWYGNDTLWRALHDLNQIIFFADTDGLIQSHPQRRYLCVVDGVIAGEGDGPLRPLPRREGVVIVGDDPLAVDLVAAHYMGFDWRRIPVLAEALATSPPWTHVRHPLEAAGIEIRSTDWNGSARAERPFLPPPGWLGKIELAPLSRAGHALS